MRHDAVEYFTSPRGRLSLMVGVFVAPLMFLTYQLVNYIFVNWACNAAGMLPVYLLTAGALIVAALGTWTSWRNWKSAGAEQTFELGGPIGRSRFIAFVGMMFSGLFFIGILAMAVPTWIMDACHP